MMMTITIEIDNPTDQQIIRTHLARGHFRSATEVIHHALASLPADDKTPPPPKPKKQNLADFLLNSPLHGSGLVIERIKDYPTPIEL